MTSRMSYQGFMSRELELVYEIPTPENDHPPLNHSGSPPFLK